MRGMALTLGVIVGSGAFVLPASVAAQLADPRQFVWVWAVGGVLALASALCYAELATTFPQTGGYVVYLRRIYGERVAFVYGWAVLLVIYPSSIAGLARVFGTSLRDLAGAGAPLPGIGWLACLAIAVAAGVNAMGVVLSARTQVLLTSLKVAALLALIVAGIAVAPGARDATAPAAAALAGAASPTALARAWFLALVFVEWCYAGFLEVVVVAGEVARPTRTLTGVLVGSVLAIGALYISYAVALERQLGMANIAASPAVAAALARSLLGGAGAVAVNAVVVVATLSATVSLLFSGPRILVALAEAGLFFPFAARLWSSRRTPAAAVAACAAVAALYACIATFDQLVRYFAFATGLFSALIVAGGMWLRWRRRIPAQARRIPGWPLPPLLTLAAALGSTIYIARSLPRASALGAALLLAALPLSPLVTRWTRRAERERGGS